MFEIQIIPAALFFCAGTIVGISATLLFNKMRTGSASAGKIKQELEDYQDEVEAHFEETSKKFKDMAAQYQDLYRHLSLGATTLCRSENSIAGLSDARDPLAMAPTIELAAKHVGAPQAANKSVDEKSVDINSPKAKSTNSKLNKQPEQKQQPEPIRAESSQAQLKKGYKNPDADKTETKPDSSKPKTPN